MNSQESNTATEQLASAAAEFAGRIVFTTSFGAEDQVITDIIAREGLRIPIVTLDTGRLFPEVYELWDKTEEKYGLRVRLSAGREHMSAEAQLLCFYAGANSLFYGDKLLTAGSDAFSDAEPHPCFNPNPCRG